jgi:uncharacterized protein
MPEDHIRYDLLAQAALRGVVRTVLADAAKNGLPGEHHFKITFVTAAPGVRLSERMRAQYPQEMTIILQHQFWDLAVREEAFDVGLSFGGIGEKLTIPFDAVSAFLDPSAQFGFQFEVAEAGLSGEAETITKAKEPEKARPALVLAETKQQPGASSPPPETEERQEPKSGEVVSLDRFRKK